jgi:hypothetical protein
MYNNYPAFGYRIPSNYNMQIGAVRFQDVINEFAERFDSYVKKLNEEASHSSVVAFWTNIASFLLAVTGFFLEFRAERESKKPETEEVVDAT